jgi:hypothetical protein
VEEDPHHPREEKQRHSLHSLFGGEKEDERFLQSIVYTTLTRLGYTPQLEVPVFNGLVTTDIAIEKPSSDGSDRLIKVSIEFDGPMHYLRPAMGSRDRVGPIDAKTRLRNALLKKCNEFEVLITIPYYEWDEVQFYNVKEEEYMKRKVMGE